MTDAALDRDVEVATEADWEPWLQQRFAVYLLAHADRSQRPVEDVGRALERLTQSPGALPRLGALAFLLDPAITVEQWLEATLPRYLSRIRVRTERVIETTRGVVRGRPDWVRTQRLQRVSGDRTLFVGSAVLRTLETPELVTVRWALARIRAAATEALGRKAKHSEGWTTRVARFAQAAAIAESHFVLRQVPVRAPTPAERAVAVASSEPAVREAAALLAAHARLVPRPDELALRDSLSRFALAPVNIDVRFQLFALLALLDALGRALPNIIRVDTAIDYDREHVAAWRGADFELRVHYDNGAEEGVHRDLMRHYLHTNRFLRPDLRVVLQRGSAERELILDAKRSSDLGYLAESHHKMRGYLADRPHCFRYEGVKAVIICPGRGLGSPRPKDDVVFVGHDAGVPGGALEVAVGGWLAAALRETDLAA